MNCLSQVKFLRSSHSHSPYSRTPSGDTGAPSLGVTGESKVMGLTRGRVRTKGVPRFLLAQIMKGEWWTAGTWPHSVRGWGGSSGGGEAELGAPNTCAWSHSRVSFPKETLTLCKQGTTTQSPAEHLALQTPQDCPPAVPSQRRGRGRGGAVSSGLPGNLNKDWGRDRSLPDRKSVV